MPAKPLAARPLSRSAWSASRHTALPRLAAIIGLGFVLAACSSGTSSSAGGGSGSAAASLATSNTDFLIRYMKQWYLWSDSIPATAEAGQYATQDLALSALRSPQDAFSYISTVADYYGFNQAGDLTGYGISYLVTSSYLLLQQVQPASPAWAAGLRRGDQILALDGNNISSFTDATALNNAIGPNQAGITGNFLVQSPLPGGVSYAAPRVVTITKATYPVTYVFAATTQASSQGTIGYIHFYSFTGGDMSAWMSAIHQVLNAGARHLIVDLRDNGGGLVNDAVSIGAELGPPGSADPSPASLTNHLAVHLQFNAQNRAYDEYHYFPADPLAGSIDQLIFITSAKTCSASELLIQALKPFRTVKTIGATTCGKPYGSVPTTYNGYVYTILSFQNINAAGETGYVNGLTPTCALDDAYLRNMGDPQERLFAGAISLIETGQCPDAAVLPKSVTPGAVAAPSKWPAWQGLSRETGFQ